MRAITTLLCAVSILWSQNKPAADEDLIKARLARDQGDVRVLGRLIEDARRTAEQKRDFQSYYRVALLNDWLCEAAGDRENGALVRSAAEAGIKAAEKSVALQAGSGDAHWVLGDLLGQLIPHAFAGGMRYGPRSTRDLQAALAIDPNHTNANISRAIAYFLTPSMFGGDHTKAIQLLSKVADANASDDSTATARIWLAQIYQAEGKLEQAKAEAALAVRLNPNRLFIQRAAQKVNQ